MLPALSVPLPVAASFAVRPTFRLRLRKIRLQALRALEPSATIGDELARVDAELSALRDAREPGRRIAQQLGLSSLEEELLWIATAAASDPLFLPSLKLLADSPEPHGVTVAMLARLGVADESGLHRLALDLTPAHSLFRFGLLVGETGAGAGVVAQRALLAAPRVVRHLAGLDELPGELMPVCSFVEAPEGLLFDTAQDETLARLRELISGAQAPTVLLVGPSGSGRTTAVAAAAGGRALVLDAAKLVGHDLGGMLTSFRRECLITGAAPAIRVTSLTPADHAALSRALEEHGGVTIVTDDHALALDLRAGVTSLDWPVPDVATRTRLWQRAVPTLSAADAELLAYRYRMGVSAVMRATATATRIARARRARRGLSEVRDLCDGARHDTAERMAGLAAPVDIHDSWDDLVLPPDVLEEVHALIARVKHAHIVLEQWGFRRKLSRGAGVAALLSGPPGTGKTMVAGLIARELGLELFQVDLSKIMSKWIGETEKQLGRLFDAAEAGHALLLFDEADALFAKRTEVKGSNDRFANLEVNYLLQRVEAFGGVALLTTNLDASIDPALKRRLAAHVKFMGPDRVERATLWGRMIPMRALAEGSSDFNMDELARDFPAMTGANIRNAVLRAAFLAASEGTTLAQPHLLKAAHSEYRAMGRVLGEYERSGKPSAL